MIEQTDKTIKMHSGMTKTREDLNFLMRQLEEVLVSQGMGHLADKLPWIGDSNIPEDQMDMRLVQLYSLAFQLLNMVEENSANQLRRASETEMGKAQWRGLWASQLKKLQEAGLDEDEILVALKRTHVEPVLTAHPTEAKRMTVIEHHRELYLALVKRENPIWTPSETRQLESQIQSILERIWRTGEIYLQKPTVESERASLQHYLQNTFPEAIRRMDHNLREAWAEVGLDPKKLESVDALPSIAFGTWVGGDRDGHPLVTPRVTEDSLLDYRLRALLLVRSNLEKLRHRLSLSESRNTIPQQLLNRLSDYYLLIGQKAENITGRNPAEPWRQYVSLLIERLPLSGQSGTGDDIVLATRYLYTYRSAAELLDDLEILRKSLVEVQAHKIVQEDLDPIMRLLKIFGFHLVALDIRQNSGFHDKAISQIMHAMGMKDCDFGSWDESKRIEFLNTQLGSTEPRLRTFELLDDEAKRAVDAYAVVARTIRNFGDEGVGAFILSMTRSVSDLLSVYFIAREAGLLERNEHGVFCRVPVVPLFETVGDLQAAPKIMRVFMSHPLTRNSLHEQKRPARALPVQQVMVGYSDSNKDQGIVASQWALHRAQREMAEVADSCGVELCFFHGRGGTISRGAGPTDRFLEALPDSALTYKIRMTEQGETISYKYSNLVTATYHLELLAAGAHRYSAEKRNPLQPELEPVLDRLVEYSAKKYRSLLSKDRFIEFYRQTTPLDALEQSSIGSRPARRTGTQSLDDLRAIPWVFSWSQSRYFLPGWYGTGAALEAMKQEHAKDYELLVGSVSQSPFLRYIFTNIEESLQSVDLEMVKAYAALVEDPALRDEFLGDVLGEYETLRTHLGVIFEHPIEKRRPYFAHTIALRDQALEPLHRFQIDRLKAWRAHRGAGNEAEAAKMLPEVLLSVSSIASGLKTTG